jgi:hypothetical protein
MITYSGIKVLLFTAVVALGYVLLRLTLFIKVLWLVQILHVVRHGHVVTIIETV